MASAHFDRLSDYQRDCLRRTFRHQTSKEIARDLGRSKYAIDQAIERAVRVLGASSRIDAAQALARHEGASDRIAGDPVGLASGAAFDPSPVAAADSGTQPGDSLIGHNRQPRVNPRSAFRLPLRREGDDGNDLGIAARLGWLVVLPIAMAIAFGTFANGLKLFSDVLFAAGVAK